MVDKRKPLVRLGLGRSSFGENERSFNKASEIKF